MTFRYLPPKKCHRCKGELEMKAGHPIYAGKRQFCRKCLNEIQNSDGTINGEWFE